MLLQTFASVLTVFWPSKIHTWNCALSTGVKLNGFFTVFVIEHVSEILKNHKALYFSYVSISTVDDLKS